MRYFLSQRGVRCRAATSAAMHIVRGAVVLLFDVTVRCLRLICYLYLFAFSLLDFNAFFGSLLREICHRYSGVVLLIYANYAGAHQARVRRVRPLRSLADVELEAALLLLEVYLHVEPHLCAELQELGIQLLDLVRYSCVVPECQLYKLVHVVVKDKVILEHACSQGSQRRHLRILKQIVQKAELLPGEVNKEVHQYVLLVFYDLRLPVAENDPLIVDEPHELKF